MATDTIIAYKCPNCGGSVTFDSNLQKMKCPYCDTEFDVEALAAYDEALKNAPADVLFETPDAGNEWTDEEAQGMRIYVCKSCGGEIIGDENTAATACPYCDSPVVLAGQLSGTLKPDCVIPFKFNKQMAVDAFKKHLCGKRFLPKVFKSENHIDEIKGIYVPFWLYDADVDADITYSGKRVRTWSDSNYHYTDTSFYSIQRGGSLEFLHVPADGSSKMADDLMESLEPFDYSQAVDFKTAYLSGYFADKYDVGSDICAKRANDRIKNTTEQFFAGTVNGFTGVTAENSSVRLEKSKVQYALYPVWILNTTWKGEKFTFAMNGQTGKFVGNLPLDKATYCKWFAVVFGITAAVVYGGALLFNLLSGGTGI